MSVEARCQNCEDNLEKVTENGTELYCGNCGWSGPNTQLKEYYPKIWKEVKAEEQEYKDRQEQEKK